MARHTTGARSDAPRRTRFTRACAAIGLLAGLSLVGASAPSEATTVADTFELDGNPQQDATVVGDDWETLLNGGGTATTTTDIPIVDGSDSPADKTYFKGGGSKDVRNLNFWAHGGTDVAPDKDEIANAAAAAYLVPDGIIDADTNPDLVINFHADRISNDGDAAIGFWFFKNQITLNANGSFNGVHAEGDVLVVSDFNEGEGINTVKVFQWTGGALSAAVTLPGSGPLDCQTPGHNPHVCATENLTNQDDINSVWPYTPKPNVGVDGKYPDFTFLEGGININAVLPNSDECFASFLAETRSSTIPNAQLKDFVLDDFPICNPGTELSAAPTVAAPEIAVVGQQVTFTFTEKNDGNVPLTNVHVDTDNAACDAAMTPAPVTLAPEASQVFSCTITTGATPAVIDVVGTGHGTDPIGRDTTFCAPGTTPNPNTTVCDEEEQATARAVTILPGTELNASADPTTVKQGDTVTYTITEGNDGVAPAGYESFLGLTSNTVTASSATPGVAGDCNAELALPISGDTDADSVLDHNETWTYQCTVTAPAGSFSLQFNGSGVALAGSVPDHSQVVNFAFDPEERDDVPVTVIRPTTVLTVRASAVITYSFAETNDGNSPLTPPTPGSRTSVISLEAGAACTVSPIAYVSGDTDNDTILDQGETWNFTCQGSLAGPVGDGDPAAVSNSSTLTGIGHGTDATGDDVTFCTTPSNTQLCDTDERDRVEVTITHRPRGAN